MTLVLIIGGLILAFWLGHRRGYRVGTSYAVAVALEAIGEYAEDVNAIFNGLRSDVPASDEVQTERERRET